MLLTQVTTENNLLLITKNFTLLKSLDTLCSILRLFRYTAVHRATIFVDFYYIMY